MLRIAQAVAAPHRELVPPANNEKYVSECAFAG
jgi:hypothetical protein